MSNRRKFLQIIGGGMVLAAAASGYWAATRDPEAARLPWQTAGGTDADPRRRALSFAILSPNPHNRQPWLADLSTADEITLYCDGNRRLPATDPLDRQITIGLGGFIELLVMAAAEDGWRADVTLFPHGEPQPRLDDRPVATIRLVQDDATMKDPLFAHVLQRRTNRSAFDTNRSVNEKDLAILATAARTSSVASTNDPERVAHLRKQAWDAMLLELTTDYTAMESLDLTRIGRAEIEANPDGISLWGPMMEALDMIGMMNKKDMLDHSSSTFAQMSAALKVPFDTAMGFAWLTTNRNSRVDQINAGRDYVRLNLAATSLGLAMQPFSQALQEFPEMKPHFAAMRSTLEIAETGTLQMLVRLGYGQVVQGSPRWPYTTRIRNA